MFLARDSKKGEHLGTIFKKLKSVWQVLSAVSLVECEGVGRDSVTSSGEGAGLDFVTSSQEGEVCGQSTCLSSGCSLLSRLALICIAALCSLSFHACQPLFPLLDAFVLFPPLLVALLLQELRLDAAMMYAESV